MSFTRAELESFRDTEIGDLIAPGVKLLFVGINPGLWTAATGAHFAHPGNRFYPALAAAGITDHVIRAAEGFKEEDVAHLLARGVGISNLVRRATVKASELGAEEYRAGAVRLEGLVAEYKPRVVAVAGIVAYRVAFGRRLAKAGLQPERLAGAELWVVPNPSGLNAHETAASLAAAYRAPAVAAGVVEG